MKSDQVLATRSFPTIRFVSTRFSAKGQTATVEGQVTVRGTTRPVTLSARIYRPQGTAEGQRDRFSVYLTGTLSRAAFGATGFADLVGDEVLLDIRARIRRAD
jgi:polyisoprenoid-binding protein YceI